MFETEQFRKLPFILSISSQSWVQTRLSFSMARLFPSHRPYFGFDKLKEAVRRMRCIFKAKLFLSQPREGDLNKAPLYSFSLRKNHHKWTHKAVLEACVVDLAWTIHRGQEDGSGWLSFHSPFSTHDSVPALGSSLGRHSFNIYFTFRYSIKLRDKQKCYRNHISIL